MTATSTRVFVYGTLRDLPPKRRTTWYVDSQGESDDESEKDLPARVQGRGRSAGSRGRRGVARVASSLGVDRALVREPPVSA